MAVFIENPRKSPRMMHPTNAEKPKVTIPEKRNNAEDRLVTKICVRIEKNFPSYEAFSNSKKRKSANNTVTLAGTIINIEEKIISACELCIREICRRKILESFETVILDSELIDAT